MFFIDEEEKKDLKFMCIFPSFLLFQLKENLLKANFSTLSSENFRTLESSDLKYFGKFNFRARFCPTIKTSKDFGS